MLFVPEATFETGLVGGREDEQPAGEATVGPFCIGRTEVTHQMYARCWHDGACPEPHFPTRGTASASGAT